MALSAQFTAIPKIGRVRFTGAAMLNTARDGSGTEATNLMQLFVAGASGSRIERIIINACGTLIVSTAGMVRIYISDGTNKRLWREYPITAVTPSAGAVGFNNYNTSLIDGGLILPSGYSLWATCHVVDSAGNQFDVVAQGGDF